MTRLTAHFLLSEFGPDAEAAPLAVRDNLRELAELLESVRAEFGRPLVVSWPNGGYRPPARNKAAGGEATSHHTTGRAADFEIPGVPIREVIRRFMAADDAGRIRRYGEVIFYPYTTGHVHIALPDGKPRERLVKLREGGYAAVPAELYRAAPGAELLADAAEAVRRSPATSALVVLALVGLFVLLARASGGTA